MKRVTSCLLLLVILFASFSACAELPEGVQIDLNALSAEELLQIKDAINARLVDLGALYQEINGKSTGENVLLLQKRLVDLGYLSEATGKWDKASQTAMRDYEKVTGQKSPNGIASIAEQEEIFSSSAMVKPTPTPTATPKPTPTPDPRKEYGKFDYNKAARNPENYIGTKVKLTGYVLQALGSRDKGYDVRLATKGRYDNVVYVSIPATVDLPANILEDDALTIYAVLSGDYSYTTVLGATITLPFAIGDIVVFR